MENLKDVFSEVARREGKKTEARIGEVREIVGIIADILHEYPQVYQMLVIAGYKRAKKKKKCR